MHDDMRYDDDMMMIDDAIATRAGSSYRFYFVLLKYFEVLEVLVFFCCVSNLYVTLCPAKSRCMRLRRISVLQCRRFDDLRVSHHHMRFGLLSPVGASPEVPPVSLDGHIRDPYFVSILPTCALEENVLPGIHVSVASEATSVTYVHFGRTNIVLLETAS